MAGFSRPARSFLFSTFLLWTAHGVSSVLFNLYLVRGGFRESFVGQAISLGGFGLALAALPAGVLADRWGRRPTLMLGALLEGCAMVARVATLDPLVISASAFLAGVGQSLFAIGAAPYLTDHSGPRERTHLFSAFFAVELLAGVVGSFAGGWMPSLLERLPEAVRPGPVGAFRATLVAAGALGACAALPLAALRGLRESALEREPGHADPAAVRLLWPIGINAFLIGAGAGLVIPFMNLYFANRFDCSSAQIGLFYAAAQVMTAAAALLGPVLAQRFGKLRTATALELASLPFLVTLGAEHRLDVAVGAFWLRATLMQAGTPLLGAFVMEALPPGLRARSASLTNMVWNAGWAVSATFAGLLIQRFGYALPFYVTATLYATAAVTFYAVFRRVPEGEAGVHLSEEAKGMRGEGPATE